MRLTPRLHWSFECLATEVYESSTVRQLRRVSGFRGLRNAATRHVS